MCYKKISSNRERQWLRGNRDDLNKSDIPWSQANILSRLFFWWVMPIIKLGNKRALQKKDLYNTIPEDKSEKLGLDLEMKWFKEVSETKESKEKFKKNRPSFTNALISMFGSQYIIPGFLIFFEQCFVRIGQPLLLSQLITYFNEDSQIPVEHAYLYATGVVLCSAFIAFNNHSLCFSCQHIGMRVRVACSSLIFRKGLRLSQKALCKTDIGQMINLCSNDVNRFDLLFSFLHFLWVGPLVMIITTAVLYINIGVASIVGLVVLFIIVPIQYQIGKLFLKLRRETSEKTDDRIRLINEVIPAIRVIKMYAWEKHFIQMAELYRKLEMNVIRRTSYLRAFNATLFYISSRLYIFPTLLVLVLSGNELTPEKVFLIVALFNNIRSAMPREFSIAIQYAAEARISVKRIEEFMLLDEIPTNNTNCGNPSGLLTKPLQLQMTSKSSKIELNNVSVKWPVVLSESEECTINSASLKVRPGQLLAVVGSVGSGKSTLLNTILGELPTLRGSSVVEGRIAYCSQEPWIITGSIRQNILCGAEMDPDRYHRVIRATALEKDFKRLLHGDFSIIGEGGVSLSGGQKARVNLARCLYVDADIYLLDDPLSAVDTHVGFHIFDKAIKGFLRGKIRVLVTHQLQHLKDTDHVLLLKLGRVEFNGLYHELKNIDIKISSTEKDNSDAKLFDHEPKSFLWESLIDQTNNAKNSNCFPKKTILKHSRRQRRRRSGCTFAGSHSLKSIKSIQNGRRRLLVTNVVDRQLPTQSQDEEPVVAGVSGETYWKYFQSGSGTCSFIFFVLSCLTAEILFCASDYWLNLWTSAERARNTLNSSIISSISNINSTAEENASLTVGLHTNFENELVVDRNTGIYVYSILIGGVIIFGFLRAIHFYGISTGASVRLHGNMFQAVIRAPIQFFDKNPVGRVVNRFSRDTGIMDDTLPTVLFDPIWVVLNTLGALVTVTIVKYWLIIPALILSVIYFIIRKNYLKASLGIKRLEASTKSPVFTQLNSALVGLTTLRAHRCQLFFQKDFDHFQDVHSSSWFLCCAFPRWLGIWMDLIIVTYTACVTYACVAFVESMTSSEAGLIITAALSMNLFQFGIRQSAEMENQMTSVDRVIEYGQLEPEASDESNKDYKLPNNWPYSGAIKMEGMSLRYNSTDNPVLKNISCTIQSHEKIGIVGRTGAGKSSFIAALFRLAEPEGNIFIDGIDIKCVGLHDLRSKISLIPQEPTLFSGSLRSNLDPIGRIADDILWSAIKDVHLDVFMAGECGSTAKGLLDFEVVEGGSNLSVGERQLICLARAILRNNQILVLDEATASVDKETDKLIQLVIREKFKNCTIITIAHRLNTIIDSDKIMVLDAGELSEFDEPIRLLSNPLGIFYSLVEQTGPQAASELVNMAKKAFEGRRKEGNGKTIDQDNSDFISVESNCGVDDGMSVI